MAQILVVDDTPLIREMVIDILLVGNADEKHTIIEAGNGKEAQQIIMESGADLVVTDFSMPEMNGVELTHWIKKTHSEIPVILMSSDDLAGLSPADVFVQKPEGFSNFAEVCNRLLKQGRRDCEKKKV